MKNGPDSLIVVHFHLSNSNRIMPIYQLPLETPPEIAVAGLGRHGELALERFLVPQFWCVHLFRDPMELRVGDELFDVRAGCATLIPPAAPIEFHFPRRGVHWHAYAHFRVGAGKTAPIPALQATGTRFEALFEAMEGVIGAQQGFPSRAQAGLWNVLWELARFQEDERLDPLVRRAQEIVEQRLGQALGVGELARELGVSHNHLTRRFRAQTGQTVVDWIRQRRVERARHLLRHSTLPIKAIAAQVGLGDFHSFNKAMRRASGRSPRQWRQSSE